VTFSIHVYSLASSPKGELCILSLSGEGCVSISYFYISVLARRLDIYYCRNPTIDYRYSPIIVYWSIHMKTMISGLFRILSSNITAHRVSFRQITLIILICKDIPFLNYGLCIDWLFVAINQIVLKLLRGFPCQLTYAWIANRSVISRRLPIENVCTNKCLYHFYTCS